MRYNIRCELIGSNTVSTSSPLIDLEKQITKAKNDINQQDQFVDRLYKDKLKGIIDEEMFKRQYNNLTQEKINLKKSKKWL